MHTVPRDQTNKPEHTQERNTHRYGRVPGYTSDCANTCTYKHIINKDAWACTYEMTRTGWLFGSSCVWEDSGPVNISFSSLTSRPDSVKEAPADTQTHLSLPFLWLTSQGDIIVFDSFQFWSAERGFLTFTDLYAFTLQKLPLSLFKKDDRQFSQHALKQSNT